MKVIICGAGQVGFGIAERLAAERADVAVIDTRASLVRSITDTLEVRGFVGNAANPDVLAQAGAADADMLVAVTLTDEVNMVACQVAGTLFKIPTKIARIRAQSYLKPDWRDLFTRDGLPIDVIISPELEVGETVLRRLELPGVVDAATFADGKLTMCSTRLAEDCAVVDTPLLQLTELFPDLPARVVAVTRDGRLFVPRSVDMLLTGDIVTFLAETSQVRRTLTIFGHEEPPSSRIVIAGGGNIGVYVAQKIEERTPKARVRIIESARERAVTIADQLKRTVVLHGSALEQEILREADVENAHHVVSLTNDDQVNLLSAVLAKRLGAQHTLALTNNRGYASFARDLGVDATINPRAVTVSRILQHIRRGRIRSVYGIADGQAEIIEAEALATSPLVGKPLNSGVVPEGMRIGAILRSGQIFVPTGKTKIMANDRVVLAALSENVRKVEQLFRVSIDYF